jgi:SAM-dependent methyltransferase
MSDRDTRDIAVGNEALVARVRDRYGRIASSGGSCCGGGECSTSTSLAAALGYAESELALLPEGTDLGLGCGAPVALLDPRPGEIVLDLGSGAGIDALIAARAVGPTGRVLGVDMTDEMLDRARSNASRSGLDHVEFRRGRLENLPVETASVDAVTSNCVINLVPDKSAVFRELARVLRPGGRLVVSDIVLDGDLPDAVAGDLLAWVGCVAGAMRRERYFGLLSGAGLRDVEILKDVDYLAMTSTSLPPDLRRLLDASRMDAASLAGVVRSVTYRAWKR